MKMNPVVHFGMPAEDRKRMADFYTSAFGWQAKPLGPEMGNYVLVTTTESDEKGVPKKPGAINGGIFTKDKSDQYPGVVIQVEDIQEAMKKVAAAGGTVLGGRVSKDPDDMPGVGLFVRFRDTEGNLVTMMQPSRQ
jgi:predicted enzyme related to lactoylglutathione lyase